MRRRWWPWWEVDQQTGRVDSLTGVGDDKKKRNLDLAKFDNYVRLLRVKFCCTGHQRGEGHLRNNKGTR